MTRTSNKTAKYTTWGLLATLAATVSAPVLADPGSQQKNKNQWRNLGIAGAAIAGYGLLSHNNTATLLGAAGAAYSANRYETDRQHQSQDSSNRYDYRRYHRTDNGGGYYNNSGSYNSNGGQWRNGNNGGYSNGNTGYNSNSGYGNSSYGNSNGGQWRNNGDSSYNNNSDSQYGGNGSEDGFARRDNGRHLGWNKHQGRGGDDKHQGRD